MIPQAERKKFISPLLIRLIDDLFNDGGGLWRLAAPLIYIDGRGDMYTVPLGYITDLASVPRVPVAYWLTGNTAHAPSVLHDYLCRTGIVPRERADEIFYEAMQAIGMPEWRVWKMYQAVKLYTRKLRITAFFKRIFG